MLRTFGDRAHILYLLRIGHNHTLLLTNVALQHKTAAAPCRHSCCPVLLASEPGAPLSFQRLHRYYHAWLYYRETGRILQDISAKIPQSLSRLFAPNRQFVCFPLSVCQVFVNFVEVPEIPRPPVRVPGSAAPAAMSRWRQSRLPPHPQPASAVRLPARRSWPQTERSGCPRSAPAPENRS